MTKTETHTNKTILRIIIAGVVLLLAAGVFCGAAAAMTWKVGSADELNNAINNAVDKDEIKFTANITANIRFDRGIALTLNLDGHNLKGTDPNNSVINVSGGESAITITGDGTITGKGRGIYIEGSTVILESGTIKGNSSYAGSGVHISNDGTFTMKGGTIKDNSAYGRGGGGVYVAGSKFYMSGGTIAGNEANGEQESGNGGGVYVYCGQFYMSGGEIKNNKAASHGGGVYVDLGTFEMSGGTISDNSADANGGGVFVSASISQFSMSGGTITKNKAKGKGGIEDSGNGGGVYVGLGGTFTMKDGTICKNKADKNGGGVSVAGGWFTMEDGTISENEADKNGGGVYVWYGTFTMKGGDIIGEGTGSGDVVANYGGGVYVVSGGTFTMEKEGKIIHCRADISGGGVYVGSGGTFTMNGGDITGNKGDDYGGGVYVADGTFTMKGGSIIGLGKDGSVAAGYGGGVYVNRGTFTMADGTIITECKADDDGGGVYVAGGTFEMSGGSVAKNFASGLSSDNGLGGGVCVNGGTFMMAGGTISENKSNGSTGNGGGGGGVYVDEKGTFTVSGTPLIEHNTKKDGEANNVVLKTTTNLKLTGPLTSGGILISKVNGTDPKQGAVFGTAEAGAAGANCFGTDVGLIGTIDNGTLKWIIGAPPVPVAEVTINSSAPVRYFDITYAWTAATTNHAADTVTVKLIADVETASTLTVPANSGTGSLTFDLDGRVLKMTGTGSVISVSKGGKLILKDSSSAKTGKVTGGNAENGGGVYVSAGGTFTMSGGSITENTASLNGGGVYNAGTFLLSGGDINTCQAVYNGGGVSVSSGGTFTMSAGTIWKNTAVGVTTEEDSGSGGGVFVDGGGSFTMSGGQITENIVLKASSSGGGVFVWKNGTFTMSGTAQITKNRSTGYGGGVMVYTGGKFTLSDSGVIGSASTEGAANTAAYGAGVFVENGDFTMTGGTIGYNHASAYFGGVAFYNDDKTKDHTFDMSGGVITKNSSEMDDPTALTGAQGVAIGCSDDACGKTLFEMSGTASIPDSNTIYLANGLYITVPEAFTSAEAGAKSLLFDEQYPYGRTVAVVSGSATAADTLSHLGLSRLYESEKYELVVDSSDPKKILVKNLIFTVTFESNGGTDVSPQQVVKGKTVSKPVNPTKNKYRFAGWYTDDETFEHEYNFSTAVNADLTLYAKWNELYQITYYGNGATSGTAPFDTTWYTSGAEAIVSGNTGHLEKTGNTFSGWNTAADGSGLSYQPGAALRMTADVTLYAQWKQNTYTVTYEANGASGSAPTDSKMYAAGQNVTVQSPPPDMVRTGFDFVCWNTRADGEGTDYAAGSSLTMPEHALTLYAKWNEIPIYTLAYNANGATSGTAPETQSCASGGSLIVSNNGDLAKTGHTFSGWTTAADGSGTAYQPEETITMTANITLYAQWAPITYTITYHKNDGSPDTTESQDRYYDDGKELPADTFTRTGYTFSGWNTKSDGTGTAYQPGYTGNLASTAGASVALYAQWTPITYTITYHKNDVSPDPTESQDRYYDDGKELFPADTFTRTGYTFFGWNTESDGHGDAYDARSVVNLTDTADASVALYAQWTENEHTYTIHFDGNDATSGSMDDQTNCSYDSDITLSMNTFNKTGYTFSGWIAPGYLYLIPDKGSVKYREDQVTDDTVTLKALWTADICTVSFYKEKDDTEPYLTRSVSYDSLIPKPDDPKKPGYSLLSWYNKADDKAWNFTTDKIQAAELHLYAVWTELPPHTITIHQSPGGKVASSSSSAAEDTVIYLAVIPDSGYRLVELNSEQVDIGPGLLTFTMPGEDVDIYPVFELIPSPSPVPSHSSESQGSSTWATAAPTQTPTATPTPTPASDVPTVKPITQPTPSGATPAPFAGVLAGLGAALAVFGLRRK